MAGTECTRIMIRKIDVISAALGAIVRIFCVVKDF
jgi:hypothetical protein